MSAVYVPLRPDESDALVRLAEREHRNPRRQAQWMLRRLLIEEGFLPGRRDEPCRCQQATRSEGNDDA